MKDVIKYFFKMLLCTFFVLLVIDIVSVLLGTSILNYKYGSEIIFETIMLAVILIILKLSKNTNILVEKKENTFSSLKYAGVLLFIIAILFISNISGVIGARPGNIINVILYCILIGISEELLCRGWVQNSFLKRYGKSKKGAFISIILASLVFGSMHITNYFAGNTFLETVAQVLQTTSLGFLFGVIYYKSGNIWTSIILHAIYDFSIMISEVGAFKDCVMLNNPTFATTLATFYATLLMIGLYTVQGLKVFNWNDDYKSKRRKYNIALTIFMIGMFIPVGDSENVKVCYKYESKKINEDYEISYIYKDKYSYIDKNNNTIIIELNTENDKLIIKKELSNESFTLENILCFKIIKDDDNYKIIMKQYDENSSKLLYLESDLNNLDSIGEKIVKLDAPDLKEIGFIKMLVSNEEYFIIKTNLEDIFVIEDDKNIYLLEK